MCSRRRGEDGRRWNAARRNNEFEYMLRQEARIKAKGLDTWLLRQEIADMIATRCDPAIIQEYADVLSDREHGRR